MSLQHLSSFVVQLTTCSWPSPLLWNNRKWKAQETGDSKQESKNKEHVWHCGISNKLVKQCVSNSSWSQEKHEIGHLKHFFTDKKAGSRSSKEGLKVVIQIGREFHMRCQTQTTRRSVHDQRGLTLQAPSPSWQIFLWIPPPQPAGCRKQSISAAPQPARPQSVTARGSRESFCVRCWDRYIKKTLHLLTWGCVFSCVSADSPFSLALPQHLNHYHHLDNTEQMIFTSLVENALNYWLMNVSTCMLHV